MKCWIIKILPVLMLPFVLSESAYGGQIPIENQDIPVIVEWQDGHGFGEDGGRLYDGWAFDPESGCYVKFENGIVLVKADSILDTDNYDDFFTDTDQTMGTLAIRGQVIRHFNGNIRVVVEDVETHREKTCNLNGDNGYCFNLPTQEGRYQIKEAEAVWNKNHYKVSFDEESQEIRRDKTGLFEISVLPEGDGIENQEAWERLNEDISETDRKEPSVSASDERNDGEDYEAQPSYWPEVYLAVGILVLAYGAYRFWAGGR
ncbi:hypothetical protein [Enterocloster bolteae]|uniref:hypothetical protein n=1 Tax=Enterocloster bolteae TaxID=208479 RepID=UPI0028DC2FC7|nr:hypothetical protein [Enterocloster bolteae]